MKMFQGQGFVGLAFLSMISALWCARADAAVIQGHLPACGGYVLSPSLDERKEEAELVTRASRHDTRPEAIGLTMGVGPWRIVWATPTDSEPGVFFFRGAPKARSFVDVWGGVPQDRDEVVRWVSHKVGVPAALTQCFASRLMDEGP